MSKTENKNKILRTVSIKLDTTSGQAQALLDTRTEFISTCQSIVPVVIKNRCWNHFRLHNFSYDDLRKRSKLGSQMVCNALKNVCGSYSDLVSKKPFAKNKPIPAINFRPTGSVHYDKRTYSIKGSELSMYTILGRIKVPMVVARFQSDYLASGTPKEAELVCRNNTWYFNLALELENKEIVPVKTLKVLGIDLGENVMAATSSGKLFQGGKVRHDRDCYLSLRRRLQANGSKGAKKRLSMISGRESRYMTHVNHVVSKQLVEETIAHGCNAIAMEDLTHIRDRIKARKRERTRLHRWAWKQLQTFIEYKALAAGLYIIYVNPAYTSKTCSKCSSRGHRLKHLFECFLCASRMHSDVNAALNHERLAMSADIATGDVNHPSVLRLAQSLWL